jgi:hypothetical protein
LVRDDVSVITVAAAKDALIIPRTTRVLHNHLNCHRPPKLYRILIELEFEEIIYSVEREARLKFIQSRGIDPRRDRGDPTDGVYHGGTRVRRKLQLYVAEKGKEKKRRRRRKEGRD